ncbi:MAG: YdeI/OmpD-associated family protein [Thermoflexales bacterium]
MTLELDTEPRAVELPEDLAAALAKKKGARAAFDASAPSKRKEFVRQVVEAKAADTRARRIAKIVAEL